jgi:hypothetical protein
MNTYKDQTRIALKAIKYYAGMSEETHAYNAKVYFDNKPVGTVSNHGRGGCDDYHPSNAQANQAMQKYIATLPVIDLDSSGNASHLMLPDLEIICGHLMNQYLFEKDYRRLIKNRVLFIEDGELRNTKANISPVVLAAWSRQLAARDGVSHVFSRTSNPEDLALFIKMVDAQ